MEENSSKKNLAIAVVFTVIAFALPIIIGLPMLIMSINLMMKNFKDESGEVRFWSSIVMVADIFICLMVLMGM